MTPVANDTSVEKKKKIIVLGAGERPLCDCTLPRADQVDVLSGVVGLTTALKIQQQGKYAVTIVSEILPSDPLSIKYTSCWAVGCIRLPINQVELIP